MGPIYKPLSPFAVKAHVSTRIPAYDSGMFQLGELATQDGPALVHLERRRLLVLLFSIFNCSQSKSP